MKDQANSHLYEDTEEMRTWRGLNQEEIDQCWKELSEKIDEEVLDKYKVEDCEREAYRERGARLEWTRVRRSSKYRTRKWREDCWARIFAWLRVYNLQRQSMHEDSTEEKEMKRQQKMKVMKGMFMKIRSKGRMDAENRWWVAELRRRCTKCINTE